MSEQKGRYAGACLCVCLCVFGHVCLCICVCVCVYCMFCFQECLHFVHRQRDGEYFGTFSCQGGKKKKRMRNMPKSFAIKPHLSLSLSSFFIYLLIHTYKYHLSNSGMQATLCKTDCCIGRGHSLPAAASCTTAQARTSAFSWRLLESLGGCSVAGR